MTTAVSLLPVPPDGVRWTTRSLAVLDPDLSLERFEDLLRAAGEFKTAASFWIGDLINFGEARYGERYAQALDATGLSYSTLSNYAYVCRQIAPSRRRDGLRFSHHAEVAALEPAEQDGWLARAEEHGWSRERLRDEIRDAGLLPPAEPKVPAAREVLDGVSVVDASREVGVVREALQMTKDALEGATVEGLEERLPGALRALDGLGRTVTAAARRMATSSLRESAERVVRQATRSSGFAMVPLDVFEAFVAALEREGK